MYFVFICYYRFMHSTLITYCTFYIFIAYFSFNLIIFIFCGLYYNYTRYIQYIYITTFTNATIIFLLFPNFWRLSLFFLCYSWFDCGLLIQAWFHHQTQAKAALFITFTSFCLFQSKILLNACVLWWKEEKIPFWYFK